MESDKKDASSKQIHSEWRRFVESCKKVSISHGRLQCHLSNASYPKSFQVCSSQSVIVWGNSSKMGFYALLRARSRCQLSVHTCEEQKK